MMDKRWLNKRVLAVSVLWLFIGTGLVLLSLYIDVALGFIVSLIFFGISYMISGISAYGRGNPYGRMFLSPQPNEIEYSSYRSNYEETMKRRKASTTPRVNWFVLFIGIITFVISIYLLITS